MGTRALTGTVGTVLVGTLIGFFLASAVGIVVQDRGVLGGNGESPVARAYMLGLLQRDPNSISSIRPQQGIAQRAAELQGASSRSSAATQPPSLAYLGGGSAGPATESSYIGGGRDPAADVRF